MKYKYNDLTTFETDAAQTHDAICIPGPTTYTQIQHRLDLNQITHNPSHTHTHTIHTERRRERRRERLNTQPTTHTHTQYHTIQHTHTHNTQCKMQPNPHRIHTHTHSHNTHTQHNNQQPTHLLLCIVVTLDTSHKETSPLN